MVQKELFMYFKRIILFLEIGEKTTKRDWSKGQSMILLIGKHENLLKKILMILKGSKNW